jgi:hypothetical protein
LDHQLLESSNLARRDRWDLKNERGDEKSISRSGQRTSREEKNRREVDVRAFPVLS